MTTSYILIVKAVRRRTLKGDNTFADFIESLSEEDKKRFFKPVRKIIKRTFLSKSPFVSIIMPAFNEQTEILPTILSYARLDIENIPVELIIADNRSDDNTAAIIDHCGVKRVLCEQKGVAFARAAGYEASNHCSKYIWITDSDTRVIPPITDTKSIRSTSSVLRTAFDFMEKNESFLGISTCAQVEYAHWSYRVARYLAVSSGRSRKHSCWAGCNQFIRRQAIEELGGMDTSVDWDEDHHRHFQLARLGKRTKRHLDSGNRNDKLLDPVFFSGRRFSSLKLIIKHLRDNSKKPPLEKDQYGYPIHKPSVSWRDVR